MRGGNRIGGAPRFTGHIKIKLDEAAICRSYGKRKLEDHAARWLRPLFAPGNSIFELNHPHRIFFNAILGVYTMADCEFEATYTVVDEQTSSAENLQTKSTVVWATL